MSQTEHNEPNVNEPTKKFVKILIDQIIKNNAADDSIFYYPKTYFGGIPDVNIHYTKGIIRSHNIRYDLIIYFKMILKNFLHALS